MDPLAQLQDIQLPEQVSNYPIAPGWILVYIFSVSLFCYLVFKLKQKAQRQKNQKLALKQLLTVNNASDIMKTLKWAAIAYFPRQQVANLSDKSLYNFLLTTLAEKHHNNFKEQCQDLLTHYYQKTLNQQECEQLKSAVNLWIKYALPPKKSVMQTFSAMQQQEVS